jgi:hypothetical protein
LGKNLIILADSSTKLADLFWAKLEIQVPKRKINMVDSFFRMVKVINSMKKAIGRVPN